MGLFDQCFAHLGNHNREEPLKFKIERRADPDPGHTWLLGEPLVSIQPLTQIREARFDLIERAQELARKQQEDDDEAR